MARLCGAFLLNYGFFPSSRETAPCAALPYGRKGRKGRKGSEGNPRDTRRSGSGVRGGGTLSSCFRDPPLHRKHAVKRGSAFQPQCGEQNQKGRSLWNSGVHISDSPRYFTSSTMEVQWKSTGSLSIEECQSIGFCLFSEVMYSLLSTSRCSDRDRTPRSAFKGGADESPMEVQEEWKSSVEDSLE